MDRGGELRAGDEFAGHRIEGVAGRGGMGVVYRATALDLQRPVALKLVAPGLAEDEVFRERFERETRTAASLDHPNVVPVFYAGEEEGRLFIAMRYVDGDDLRALLRREVRLGAERAAHIVAQVAAALDAAHARGIVHRDVKPGNVLLGAGDHAYLTDFGLTKRLGGSAASQGTTRAGGWVGTLGYVAPEQIRGGTIDARTDVYALGSVLFHALTGSMPYARESDEATLWAHLHDPPPAVLPGAPDVPLGFEEVVARAMAKDPADRYPSAGDLGRAALAAAGRAPIPDRSGEHAVGTGRAEVDDDDGPPTDIETRVSPTLLAAEDATRLASGPGGSQRPARARARARRRTVLATAAALVLLGGAAAAALVLLGSDDTSTASTTMANVPPKGPTGPTATPPTGPVVGKLIKTIKIGFAPEQVNVAEGKVWVAAGRQSDLTLLSATTGTRLSTRPEVGEGASVLASGYKSIWVGKQGMQNVLRYDAKTMKRVGAIAQLPPGAIVAMTTGSGAVWAASGPPRHGTGGDVLTKIDKDTGAVSAASIPTPDGVQDAAVGYGAVWVVGRHQPYVARVDTHTGHAQRITVHGRPQHVAVGGGSVWVTNSNGTVTEISPGENRVLQQITFPGGHPGAIAVGNNGVWVADIEAGTLTRIDPATGTVFPRPLAVGKRPINMTVRSGHVWVALKGEDAIARVDFDPDLRP